jgi:hypothetical protein
MVAANSEATVAVTFLTEKESSEEFGEAVEAFDESELLRQRVAYLLDTAGNESLNLMKSWCALDSEPRTLWGLRSYGHPVPLTLGAKRMGGRLEPALIPFARSLKIRQRHK